MNRLYLPPEQFSSPPPPYRTGEAGHVWLSKQGVETDVQVRLSANTTHALIGHGVIDALNALPLEGKVGRGTDALIPHAVLDDAQSVFYAADRNTYGGNWEFVVASCAAPNPVEWCIRIENREYQRTLSRLTFLLGTASRAGLAARLRI